jgi:transcriptional regulator with XRE-family HTH domain
MSISNHGYLDDMAASGRPTDRQRTSFGQRLVQAREEAGLSQQELARKLRVSPRAIGWWEREPAALKPEQLAALADALNVPVDYLLGRQYLPNRGSGPVGKLRRVFERVNRLPRQQQNKVVEFVEAFVNQHTQKE